MTAFARTALAARRSGKLDEAEAAYRAWMAAEPSSAGPRYGLSLLLLRRGAYAEGWKLYEARKAVPELKMSPPRLRYPEWRGQTVKSLLLWPEQGLGDQIMFARFIAELVSSGIEVTLLAPPPLYRLFGALDCSVVEAAGRVELAPHDAWCFVGSLPLHIGTIPSDPYLPSLPGGKGVGVMVAGNPKHVNDEDRSLRGAAAARMLSLGLNLTPEETGAADFYDTARIIDGLAKVVSVDTSVAHLAGAMGKPVDIILGRDPDWRWGTDGEETIWYPSARLIRS